MLFLKTIEVPYGRGVQSCSLPDKVHCFYGELKQVEPAALVEEQITAALEGLIGNINLEKLKQAKSIAIAISDITRPVPSRLILERLFIWLGQFGISEDQVTILVGGGLHRPATQKDLEYILGENLLSRIKKVIAHDAECLEDLAFLGNSSQGTPVYVNKYFVEAEYRIVTGMVDAHQFMGFTAGVKGAVIGLGGRATITANHARLFEPGAELGHIEGNPARLDLEEIGQIIGVDMIVNVVLNDKKKVVKAIAGHPVSAHRVAVEFAKGVFGVKIPQTDIVIASPGGFPKDINIYQAQKALTPALQIVKPGGTIILVAQCSEGSGEKSFEIEMAQYKNHQDLITSFRKKEFVIGPHKAYLWSRTFIKARIILVSDQISKNLAQTLMVEVKGTLQEAVDQVISNDLGNHTGKIDIAILPNANSVIPLI